MQFSIPPWFFDEETNKICHRMVAIHQTLSPYIIELAKRLDGIPIIRPMFWTNTSDPELFTIIDQFIVGDSLVVAPVLGK
jgi:alpha-glucosidase